MRSCSRMRRGASGPARWRDTRTSAARSSASSGGSRTWGPASRAGSRWTAPDTPGATLGPAHLRGALRRAATVSAEKRRAAMAAASDWEGARDRARAIKDETLLHLDRYLEEFTANAERAGARTHWARDAAEACEIIGRIAEQSGARSEVKSKSMASEEIHLNERLTRRGIEQIGRAHV